MNSQSTQANSSKRTNSPKRRCVLICQHRSCQRNNSEAVLHAFQTAKAEGKIEGVFINASECMGQCSSGPTVQVSPDRVWYCQVTPEDVPAIVEEHLKGDQPIERLLHPRFHPRFG